MRLVEQHVIGKNDSRYAVIDSACFASKNLYNYANYIVRQSFIHEHIYKGYAVVYHEVKSHESYQALPAKVANDVLRLLDKNWKSFFQAIKAYMQDPPPFVGRPALPKYKDKQKGRNILIYDIQALSKKGLKKGLIQPSLLGIEVPTRQTHVQQVRIIPRCGFYMVEVVYEKPETQASVDPSLMASGDIGVNNLVALTSNKLGFIPRLVNGRPIKSVNQFYNKRKATLQEKLGSDTRFTPRMERITMKRTRRIDHYLHTASKRIIDLLVDEGIGTLIIGKNPLWKQDPTMRKKDAQHFVQLPHARFIDMLCYKARLVGIQVILQEESYTSKASFLDNDPIPTYGKVEDEPIFLGKRVKRGLYQSRHGIRFNADINGSYNILRKAVPNAFGQGNRGCAVHPIWLHIETLQ
jgi:putative transposase